MGKKEMINMLRDEIKGKVDAETFEKLQKAGSAKEALAMLDELSIPLDDNMLSAVAGGDGEDVSSCSWDCNSDSCSDLCRGIM